MAQSLANASFFQKGLKVSNFQFRMRVFVDNRVSENSTKLMYLLLLFHTTKVETTVVLQVAPTIWLTRASQHTIDLHDR